MRSTAGKISLGTAKVAITHTIVLQGGEEGGQAKFVGAENGETLSKTAQVVPGGLPAVVAFQELPPEQRKIYDGVVKAGLTGVNVTFELVGQPSFNLSNLLEEAGVAFTLPLRAHLENTFLGSECYIGSQSSPILLELTDGTTSPPKPNQPISGTLGEIEFEDEFELAIIKHNKLVDNAFSEPEAKGCGGIYAAQVNPTVNTQLALPSAAGQNTAILEGTIELATAEAVRASE